MQVHIILKFGSFVVLFEPLKTFFQITDAIFTANQNSPEFLWGNHKSAVLITALFELAMQSNHTHSVADTFTVPTNHLQG